MRLVKNPVTFIVTSAYLKQNLKDLCILEFLGPGYRATFHSTLTCKYALKIPTKRTGKDNFPKIYKY